MKYFIVILTLNCFFNLLSSFTITSSNKIAEHLKLPPLQNAETDSASEKIVQNQLLHNGIALDQSLQVSAPKQFDFSSQAVGLFASYRIPAMLVAGAAYGGVWALPLSDHEELVIQLAKRTYILIGLMTVISELITTVVATMGIDRLSLHDGSGRDVQLTTNIQSFLSNNIEMEWVATRVNFLFGLIGFATMCGLRAWISLSCPQFGWLSSLPQ